MSAGVLTLTAMTKCQKVIYRDQIAALLALSKVQHQDKSYRARLRPAPTTAPTVGLALDFKTLARRLMALSEAQKEARAENRRIAAAQSAADDALRHEARRREWQEKGMYVTREQAAAGEGCRGCGLPVIDNLGSWRPLMQLNEKQRFERKVADAAFTERHQDSHAHRWSMEGSRATHCGLCCPPLPLSPSQMENISRILNSVTRRDEELDVWAPPSRAGSALHKSLQVRLDCSLR